MSAMDKLNESVLSGPPKSKLAGRTLELKLLAFGFLAASAFGWLRMVQAIVTWNWLEQIIPMPSPAYLAFSGAVWGLIGLFCAVSLWLRFKAAPLFARLAACSMVFWYWMERFLLTRSPQGWVNWPFSLGMTVVCLAFVFAVLASPRQKRFFARQ
jgi:hypothetical protein